VCGVDSAAGASTSRHTARAARAPATVSRAAQTSSAVLSDVDVLHFRVFAYLLADPFSALTLLVGRQERHPACKKLNGGVLMWLSVWSEVQTCVWPS